MTERCYYEDAYTTAFEARVLEELTYEGKPGVVLDKTFFYPSSGGQPFDKGTIAGRQVIDVFVRDSDEAIVHILSGPLGQDPIEAKVDWRRRFDHMQQHTGQHILSQAFIRVAAAETVSFHLGQESSTIDLRLDEMAPGQLEEVELLANRVIWENRPVQVMMLPQSEAAKYDLRKVPELSQSFIRIIDISDFDQTACGGTHVANSGQIGVIKVLRAVRFRGNLRLEFLCGRRALDDYDRKNSILHHLATELTTGQDELAQAVDRLRQELKSSQRQRKQQQKKLLTYEAAELLAAKTVKGETTIVSYVFIDRDPGELRVLANQLARNPNIVVLLGLAGPKSQLLFARSLDASGDMNELLKHALKSLGMAGGGGNAKFVQGGGPPANRALISEALKTAENML